MLNDHLSSPVTRQRLRSGPAAGYVDDFADWLHCRGYRPATNKDLLHPLASWTDWMHAAGFTALDVNAIVFASDDVLNGLSKFARQPSGQTFGETASAMRRDLWGHRHRLGSELVELFQTSPAIESGRCKVLCCSDRGYS